jgi:hypothetical protein
MGGISSLRVLCALVACALSIAQSAASDLDVLRALALEKSAAVFLFKSKGEGQVARLAQDRVFAAYLNASTQGEGVRLKARIAAMFATVSSRFGLRDLALFDRSGELVVRTGAKSGASASLDVKRDPVLAAGFALAPVRVATVTDGDGLTFATPVVWREQKEFVLRARQEPAAYRTIMARGVPEGAFVVLVDAKGQTLADTRDGKPARLIAGFSLDGLRKAVKGKPGEGAGEVARGKDRFYVSYRSAGEWTVIAAKAAAFPHHCPNEGTRLCG